MKMTKIIMCLVSFIAFSTAANGNNFAKDKSSALTTGNINSGRSIDKLKQIPANLIDIDYPVIVNEITRTGELKKGSIRFAPNGVYLKVENKDKFGSYWCLIDIKKKGDTLVLTLNHFEDAYDSINKFVVLVCDITDLNLIKIQYIEYSSRTFR